jgi:hypothetical protein
MMLGLVNSPAVAQQIPVGLGRLADDFGVGTDTGVLDSSSGTLTSAGGSTISPTGILTIDPTAYQTAIANLNANGLDVVGVLPADGSGMPSGSSADSSGNSALNILNCGTSNCGGLTPAPSNYNYTPPTTPTSTPLCGTGSTEWINGIDNCVLMAIGGGTLLLLVLIGGKGGKKVRR